MTSIETGVRELWAELLGVPPDKVDDHEGLFAAGGTSLQAVRLMGRLRDAFGVEVDLPTIFVEGSVAALTEKIESVLVAELDGISDEEAARLLEDEDD
jgi:acyl carrier protein